MKIYSHYSCLVGIKKKLSVLPLLMVILVSNVSRAEEITLFTYEIPGLISSDNQRPVGIAVETLRILFERAGYQVNFQLHPFARVKSSVAKYPNSCGFPVNYSPARERTIDYMLPLSLVKTEFYSLEEGPKSLAELRDKYVVSLIQHAAQPQLDSMDMSLLYVANANTAINLLLAKRADYLVLDDSMAHAASIEHQVPLYPVHTLTRNATYLVCNKQVPELSQALLEQTFIDMLNDGSLKHAWTEQQLAELYSAVFGNKGERWHLLLNQFRIALNDKTSAVRKTS